MIGFIPLEFYTGFYYFVILIIVILTFLQTFSYNLNSPNNLQFIKVTGIVSLLFTWLFMGLRPVSGVYFLDMETYAKIFENYAAGAPIISDRDVVFDVFTKLCS